MDSPLYDSTWVILPSKDSWELRIAASTNASADFAFSSFRRDVCKPALGSASSNSRDREDLSAEMASLPRVVGRYVIGGEIARGGMGVVCLAMDRDLQREVALKVLRSKHRRNPELTRRFFDEARIAGSLQHPGVVPIYEVGHLDDGRPYFAMKYVGGNGLDQLLAARPDARHNLPKFLKVFEQVCHTIAFAHSRRVIHRDLKPSNIMVGVFGEALVMDWGLSKQGHAGDDSSLLARLATEAALEDEQSAPSQPATTDEPLNEKPADPDQLKTQLGRVFGTPAYMSPEQARGEIGLLDERADVFGLGAILCEILTCKPPYVPGNDHDVYEQALLGELTDALARLDQCVGLAELVSLARRCLSPDRDVRPHNAEEVATAISQYIECSLQQAERDLVRFFELSLDLFCIAGFDGYFRRVNSNFSRVLGFSDEQLLATPFLEFIHPDDRTATLRAVAQAASGLPVIRFRNRYRDASGAYRWFEWMGKGIEGEGTIFAVARDITDEVARAATA